MPRLLINIILCTLLFICTAHSAILTKYKDGICIDSLIQNWRPTDYKTVKALLEREKIEHKEEEDYGCSFIYSEYMITLRFNKVYYKGLYIGGGFLFFGHTSRQKVRYPLLCFRTEIPHSSVHNEKPKVNDIKTCYRLLNTLFTKRFGSQNDLKYSTITNIATQDSLINIILNDYKIDKYDPDEKLNILNTDDRGRTKYRWYGKLNNSEVYIFLFLNRKTSLEFQIGTFGTLY